MRIALSPPIEKKTVFSSLSSGEVFETSDELFIKTGGIHGYNAVRFADGSNFSFPESRTVKPRPDCFLASDGSVN